MNLPFRKKTTSNPAVNKSEVVALYRQALAQDVPLDKLHQTVSKLSTRAATTQTVDTKNEVARKKKMWSELPISVRVVSWALPLTFLGFGGLLLGSALLPILTHLITVAPKLQASQLTAPIPQEEVLSVVPTVVAPDGSGGGSGTTAYPSSPKILDEQLDYTNLSNWFLSPTPELAQGAADSYTLEIPKIDIKNAEVKIGGTNLNKSLIQYPGTANPGGYGSPVIFGHSVLRQFYNPSEKNPNRYNSIFSTIMTLEPGDEIFVTSNGVRYTYVVTDKTEVKPEDTYILAQRPDSQTLKLVTCTPEGTYLRRGVITAQLVEQS